MTEQCLDTTVLIPGAVTFFQIIGTELTSGKQFDRRPIPVFLSRCSSQCSLWTTLSESLGSVLNMQIPEFHSKQNEWGLFEATLGTLNFSKHFRGFLFLNYYFLNRELILDRHVMVRNNIEKLSVSFLSVSQWSHLAKL